MSRRRKSIPGEENIEAAGPAKELIVAIIIVILLVAGMGSAVYFMAGNSDSGAGIDYGDGNSDGGDSTDGGSDSTEDDSGNTEENNLIAIINIRSEDGNILGTIEVELYREKAPITVDNFIRYASNKLYDGTLFHRVEKDFVVQGGGYYPNNTHIETYPPIKNEAKNGLHNTKWTVAMARTSDPDSATSEFFVNMKDNSGILDPTPQSAGYAVFGKVISGFDILNEINGVDTIEINPQFHKPEVNIIIQSVVIQGT